MESLERFMSNDRGLYYKTVRLYRGLYKKHICDTCNITIQYVTKIEDNPTYISISRETDKMWQKALKIKVNNDYELIDQFMDDFNKFISNCVYCFKSDARKLFDDKYTDYEKYINLEIFPNYLLMRFVYSVLFDSGSEECNILLNILEKISNHFTGRIAQIFYLYAGVYYKNINKLLLSEECIIRSKMMGSDELMLSMDYYQLSILSSKNNHNLEGLMHTIKAKEFFEKTNNFIRNAQCVSHMGVLFIHLGNFGMAEQFCKEGIVLAERLKNNNILAVNYCNLSWVNLVNGQYECVPELISLSFQNGRNDTSLYFQNAFAYMKMKEYKKAKNWALDGIGTIEDRNRLHYRALRMIQRICEQPNFREEYVEAVVKKIDDKKQQHDVDLIQLLYQELIECKKEKKKFEEAFYYLEKMNEIRKNSNRG